MLPLDVRLNDTIIKIIRLKRIDLEGDRGRVNRVLNDTDQKAVVPFFAVADHEIIRVIHDRFGVKIRHQRSPHNIDIRIDSRPPVQGGRAMCIEPSVLRLSIWEKYGVFPINIRDAGKKDDLAFRLNVGYLSDRDHDTAVPVIVTVAFLELSCALTMFTVVAVLALFTVSTPSGETLKEPSTIPEEVKFTALE